MAAQQARSLNQKVKTPNVLNPRNTNGNRLYIYVAASCVMMMTTYCYYTLFHPAIEYP